MKSSPGRIETTSSMILPASRITRSVPTAVALKEQKIQEIDNVTSGNPDAAPRPKVRIDDKGRTSGDQSGSMGEVAADVLQRLLRIQLKHGEPDIISPVN
jgi:hypothetical protein